MKFEVIILGVSALVAVATAGAVPSKVTYKNMIRDDCLDDYHVCAMSGNFLRKCDFELNRCIHTTAAPQAIDPHHHELHHNEDSDHEQHHNVHHDDDWAHAVEQATYMHHPSSVMMGQSGVAFYPHPSDHSRSHREMFELYDEAEEEEAELEWAAVSQFRRFLHHLRNLRRVNDY